MGCSIHLTHLYIHTCILSRPLCTAIHAAGGGTRTLEDHVTDDSPRVHFFVSTSTPQLSNFGTDELGTQLLTCEPFCGGACFFAHSPSCSCILRLEALGAALVGLFHVRLFIALGHAALLYLGSRLMDVFVLVKNTKNSNPPQKEKTNCESRSVRSIDHLMSCN